MEPMEEENLMYGATSKTDESAGALERRRKRAHYRANHRGTKELDWLMGRFADARVPTMEAADLALFEALLALPDPELHAALMAPQGIARADQRGLIREIREFHGLDPQ